MAPGGGGKALLARASLFGGAIFCGEGGGGQGPLAPPWIRACTYTHTHTQTARQTDRQTDTQTPKVVALNS